MSRLNCLQEVLGCDCHKDHPPPSFENTPLVWDSGASLGLTPYRADFFDYVKVDIAVKDVTKMNKVIGIGTVIFKFSNDKGEDVFLPCIAYHFPTSDIRLFSPQTYHQMHDGHSTLNKDEVLMELEDHRIVIPVDKGPSNLPMVWDPLVSLPKPRLIIEIFFVDMFGDVQCLFLIQSCKMDRSFQSGTIVLGWDNSWVFWMNNLLLWRWFKI